MFVESRFSQSKPILQYYEEVIPEHVCYKNILLL